jgi:uncharacterized iron-regulated membrane protein
MAYYNYLLVIGLWKDVLAVLVAAALAWVLRIGRRLKKIEQHLDTTTPGGLTDVVNAMQAHNQADKEVE